MADLAREDKPPKAGPKWWVERVKGGCDCLYTIFSLSVFGVWTHWGLYGSQPCLAERSRCGGCQNKLPRRWKGYLHAYNNHAKRQCFIELTPQMVESMQQQLGEGQPVRGYRLQIKRGRGDKARCKVTVLPPLVGGPDLVAERCPEETLRKLWAIDDFPNTEDRDVEV